MHVGRIPILGGLQQFDFVITEEVAGEIEWPQQQEQLQAALSAGILRTEPTSDLPVVTMFAELRQQRERAKRPRWLLPATKAG